MVREEKAMYEFERRYAVTFETLFSYADAARMYAELWFRHKSRGV